MIEINIKKIILEKYDILRIIYIVLKRNILKEYWNVEILEYWNNIV